MAEQWHVLDARVEFGEACAKNAPRDRRVYGTCVSNCGAR